MTADTTGPDWYKILGVDPAASDAEIGRAFRTLARRFHPDVGADASDDRFSDVAQAYEVLGDPGRRADYDRARSGIGGAGIRIPVRRWAAGPTQTPVADPAPAADRRPDEPEVEVAVTLAESITGTTARVSLPAAATCPECSGSGRRSGGACAACGGEGRYRRQSGSITINRICPECAGSGARPPQRCASCGGRGWSEQARQLTVRVPPGVVDGTRLRLRSSTGQAAGSARVRLQEDRWFSREGRDLVLRLPLSISEAALGTVVAAALPDGPVAITVPPGTAPGRRLRIPGRGIPGSARGDLVAAVEVVIPQALSDAERAALEALSAAGSNPREGWPAAGGGGPDGPAAPNGPGTRPGDDSHDEHNPTTKTDRRETDVHDAL